MIRCIPPSTVALLLLGLTGCAGSGAVSSGPPDTLRDANRVLDGREARIVFTDSTEAMGQEVTVAADSVRFWTDSFRRAVATAEVQRITYERDRFSPGTGGAIGALVGFAFGFGFGAMDGNLDYWDQLGMALTTVVGSLLGTTMGVLEGEGAQSRTAYEAPLSRYGGARE